MASSAVYPEDKVFCEPKADDGCVAKTNTNPTSNATGGIDVCPTTCMSPTPGAYEDVSGATSSSCPRTPAGVTFEEKPLPEVPPSDCVTFGLKGYGRPMQHPLFQTTNSEYGRIVPPPGLIPKRRAFDSKFTTHLAQFGSYDDSHFTNELDREFIHRPPTYYY